MKPFSDEKLTRVVAKVRSLGGSCFGICRQPSSGCARLWSCWLRVRGKKRDRIAEWFMPEAKLVRLIQATGMELVYTESVGMIDNAGMLSRNA